MKRIERVLCITIFFGLTACASVGDMKTEFKGSPYFEDPPARTLFSDKELFNQALSLQYKGQLQPAINLWQKFVTEHSRSFEAINNLGMAYYSNDELDKAIESFESALELEPANARIKKNLRRTLRFRITLHKENREYGPAIKDLKKISALSPKDRKERILREIEDLQEKIFSEVERINTVAEYQNFLANYPTGIYANKVREKLKELAPQLAEAAPEKPKEFLPALMPESPPGETQAEPKPSPQMESEKALSDTLIEEPEPSMPETLMAKETMLPDESTMGKTQIMKKELTESMTSPAAGEPEPQSRIRKVQIVTKSSVLNIRVQPSLQARVIGKLKKGAKVRVIDENTKWYRVVFATGKDGWVSKRFAKEIE